MKHNHLAAAASIALTLGATAAAPAVSSDVRVRPMHSKGSQVRYPRLVAFPNPAVQKQVNALLAQREAEREQNRMECRNTFRDTHHKSGKQSFNVAIDVSYLSQHYLSLDIRQSEYCGGPYPDVDVPDPLTIDLTKGAALDWKAVFKPGVLPDPQGNGKVTPQLLAMYQARYASAGSKDPACQAAVKTALSQLILRLDAKKGLVVWPDFPHAAQACAVEIAFSPDEVAPLVGAPTFLADLKTTAAGDATANKGGAR